MNLNIHIAATPVIKVKNLTVKRALFISLSTSLFTNLPVLSYIIYGIDSVISTFFLMPFKNR